MKSVRIKLGVAFAGVVVVAVVVAGMASAANPFTDLRPGAFYEEAVDWAFNNGVTTGTSATEFSPDATTTRGQVVTFIKRHDDLLDARDDLLDARVDGIDFRLGRVNLLETDLALDIGETVSGPPLDGVTVSFSCADVGGLPDLRIFVTSDADGWYVPSASSTVLASTDEVDIIPLGTFGPSGAEIAENIGFGSTIRTPNGGYIGVGSGTTMSVLNPSGEAADCLVVGTVQYFFPLA